MLAIIIPLGFASKFYQGPGALWSNNYLGGILYVVFFILLAGLIFPSVSSIKICIWVVLATCILETIQLWHPPFLEFIRSYFIGRTLIGSGFDFWDFPHYIIGGIIGYSILKR